MDYGMRCHDICPKGDIDTVLDTVAENHIDKIQLAFAKSFAGYNFDAGHYSAGLAHMIGEKLAERNIHVSILGCYFNCASPDDDMRRAGVAKFIEHLKYAKIIGADMVGTETGRYSTDFSVVPETYTEKCYQTLLGTMREIVDAAEKLGVIVGIEAAHDHTLYSPEMVRRFLDDIGSPNVEVIFDPVNLIGVKDWNNQEAVLQRAFDLYGPEITVVHMKDFTMENGKKEFAHVHDGLFHYEPVMRWLKKEKPHITMLLESAKLDRYRSDVAYLQKIYDEV